MDQFYYESGYIDASYFVYTAEAESAQSSNFEMTAVVGVIKETQVTLTVTSEVQATISHIEGADLFAMSNAALAAEVSRIRDNNIEVSSAFSIATDASRTRNYSSEDAADFTISVANTRVRFNEAAVNAAFSLTVDYEVLSGVLISLTSSFSQSATALKIQTSAVSLSSEASQTTSGDRIRYSSATLETNATITADNSRTRDFASDLSSQAALSGALVTIKEFSSAQTAQATVTAVISHIEGADLQAFTNASLSAQAEVIRGLAGVLTSTASQTITALRIQDTSAAIQSAFTLSTTEQRIRFGAGAFSSASTLTADIQKIIPNYSWEAVKLSGWDPTVTFNATGRQQPTTSGYAYDVTAFRLAGIDSSVNFNLNALDTASRDLLAIGTKNATIEFWYSRTINTNSEQLVFQSGGISLYFADSPQAYRLVVTDGSTSYQASYTGGGLTLETQRHFAIVRSTTTVRLFLAGTQRISVTIPSNYNISAPASLTCFSFTDNISNAYANSTIKVDEFRYSVGIARYTTTYTPPTTAFTKDAYTRALSHFDNSLFVIPSAVQGTAALASETFALAEVSKFGTVNATAYLTSTAAVTAQLNSQQNAQASLTAFATEVIVNGRIVPEQASLESSFFMTASLDKIKNAQAGLTSQATTDATGQRIRFADSAFTSQATVTANNVRTRNVQSAVSSAFSQSTTATKIRNPIANENWYKGLSTINNTVEQMGAAYLDPYAFEFSRTVLGPDGSTVNAYILVKRNIETGNVVWQKWYRGAFATDPETIRVYNGYIYITIYRTFVKIDPEDGSIVSTWGIGLDTINDFVIDSDYVYFSGLQGSANGAVAKYSLTGTKQWSKRLNSTTRYYIYGSTIRVVGSSVYWLYDRFDNQTSVDSMRLVKLSTADGSITWSKTTGFVDSNSRMTVAPNGTVYMTGRIDTISNVGVFIGIDSSGALTGTPKHLGISNWLATGHLEYDTTTDDIYYKAETADEDIFIKLTTAGAVTWARTITSPGFFDFNQPVLTDTSVLLPGRYIDASQGGTALFNIPTTGGDDIVSTPMPSPFSGNWSWTSLTVTSTTGTYTSLADVSISLSDDTNTSPASSITIATTSYTPITYLYRVNCSGAFVSTASITATPNRIKGFAIAASSSSSLTASLVIARSGIVSATTSAQLEVTQSRVNKPVEADLIANAEQTTVGRRVRYSGSILLDTNAFTMTVGATKIARGVSSQQTQAAVQATILRIHESAVSLQAFASTLSATAKIGVGLLAMDSSFSTTVIGTKNTDTVSNQTANFALVANNVFVKNADAALTTQATVTANADKIKKIEVNAQITATLQAQVDITKRYQAQLQDNNSQITAEITRTRSTVADLQVNASVSTEATKYRSFSAELQAAFEQVANPYNVARAEAHLEAFDTVLAVGSRIRFDPYYMLKIPPESRVLTVHEESRVLMVTSETRILKVKETTYD